MASLEPELERLLLSIVPDLAEQWHGATPEEIERIEKIAGRPIPRFYRWFLSKMGRDMGLLEYTTIDFSAERILRCYAEGVIEPDPRFLLIGYETDDTVPMHFFYDLDRPIREDAQLVGMDSVGGEITDQFETFREMIAWGKFRSFRLRPLAQRCEGVIEFDRPGALARLTSAMADIGFAEPIPTGAFCKIFDRSDAGMACMNMPEEEADFILFELGGKDAVTLRMILARIATRSSLSIEVESWSPPLP